MLMLLNSNFVNVAWSDFFGRAQLKGKLNLELNYLKYVKF